MKVELGEQVLAVDEVSLRLPRVVVVGPALPLDQVVVRTLTEELSISYIAFKI